MEAVVGTPKNRTNRYLPVEQWPESLEILRHLTTQAEPRTIKQVAHAVCAPEISTRNRLARLEQLGAVQACRSVTEFAPGKHITCTHYSITQYGRDTAGTGGIELRQTVRVCANSVFALASAMKLSL